MINPFGFDIGGSSFFGSVERADKNALAVSDYFCAPFIESLVDTYDSAFSTRLANVVIVDLLRNIPEIAKPVIKRIAVNVVNGELRPFAGHIEPSQSVSEVDFPVHRYFKPSLTFAADNITNAANLPNNASSCKDSGAWIVINKLSQSVRSQRCMNDLWHWLMRIVEIGDAVIAEVAILSSQVFWRELAIHVKPCKTSSIVLATIDVDGNATAIPGRASNTSSQSHAASNAPRKNPSIGIVMQKFFKPLLSKRRITYSHDALLKLIGQRPDRADNTFWPCHYITSGVA